MKSRDKKYNDAVMTCYIELYKQSTPSADFQELMDNATINDRGQKEIPFNDYEIEEKLFDSVIDSVIKKYKFKNWEARGLKNSILLGCSPKFKRNEITN
jgi:hypothetical protein